MSERAYLSIGEVLQLLHDEFPDVTISKIRFLESQGLIDPERTASGYRKFYDPDIDRLRFILREQKDSYLPLKVIKDRLDAGETTGPVVRPLPGEPFVSEPPGHDSDPVGAVGGAAVDPPDADGAGSTPPTNVPSRTSHPSAGRPPLAAGAIFTFEELVGASGLTPAQLREVERYGLLVGRPVGPTTYYDDEAVVIAKLASGFLRFGIEPRHLRMYRSAAEREAGVFEQVILPLVKQRNPKARGEALTHLSELTRLGSSLRDAMVRQALRGYTESL